MHNSTALDVTAPSCSGLAAALASGSAVELGRTMVVLGDLDGNGVQDVAIGASGGDGAVHVVRLGGPDGTQCVGSYAISKTSGDMPSGEFAKPRFGQRMSALGDVDQDGVPDLLVGTSGSYVGNNLHNGQAFVLLLRADGTVHNYLVIDVSASSLNYYLFLAYFGEGTATIMSGDEVAAAGAGHGCKIAIREYESAVVIVNVEMSGAALVLGTHNRLAYSAVGGTNDGDDWGQIMAGVGDVNGDSVHDLAVAAPSRDSNFGSVFVMFLDVSDSVSSFVELSRAGGSLSQFVSLGSYDLV